MTLPERQRHIHRPRRRGFALVVCVMMMVLLTLIGVGFMGLATVELRKSPGNQAMAEARANARLALMEAIGQLQRELGPDQRISATGSILGEKERRHWTGVWDTRDEGGKSFWTRDPETGSLLDGREENGWKPAERMRGWLVSGESSGEEVELVGTGSAGNDAAGWVKVPLVEVAGANRGRMAWWTGDLGVRANVSVPDAHGDKEVVRGAGDESGYFRLLASQQADSGLMGEGMTLENERRASFATAATVGLARPAGGDWVKRHFHDFTTRSEGVLADVRDGGLKRDLTAYFESDGELPGFGGLTGIRDQDLLLADGADSRFQRAGPRFGVLRDWVATAAPISGKGVASVAPEGENSPDQTSLEALSEKYALANMVPARVAGRTKTSLEPVLVEGSFFMQISTFKTAAGTFQLRHHLYPRVVLWNPYNVELDFDPAIVMIQGNGRQEMWTRDALGLRSMWVSFEGGRSTGFVDGSLAQLLESDDYHDPYMGSYYFSVPRTTFGPGECLVFSPARAQEYDGLSAYRTGSYNLANNQLSCEVSPDVSRSFYVSGSDIGGGVPRLPKAFWYAPTPFYFLGLGKGIENQGDDTRVVMKSLGNATSVTFETFDTLPQLAYLSASLQFGAGKEPRIAWNDRSPMDIELLDYQSPASRAEPDVRTREGIRLRWFEEHPSNTGNAGRLAGETRFFEEASFANWNPRAAYSVRSPWENIGGSMPVTGNGGGPWFFGTYTRDLYDESVGWSRQAPVFRGGRYHGNPFGLPQEGRERYVMFELPRAEIGLVSMGQLQNVQLSEFVWHPSFALGNSLVDPRLGLDGMNRTVPPSGSGDEDQLGGFHRDAIGWSTDSQRSAGRDEWAETGRALLQQVPEKDHVVYDLSFEVNHAMWDRYFVSSGDQAAKRRFESDPAANPLPSGRMRLASGRSGNLAEATDFHRAAARLVVDGAFNVNSTSVEAWKAVLGATRGVAGGGTTFARVIDPPEGALAAGDRADLEEAWAGRRELNDEEIGRLAMALVEEVKLRGPFLSMSDFVNRRLANDETGRCGPLQAAIDRAGINSAFESVYPLDNSASLGDYDHPDNVADATRLEQTLKPKTKAWGAPGFLTQGDVLQVLAPVLSARSDSFVIRAYGESIQADGKAGARAWCEAVVQRKPRPLKADASGLNPANPGGPGDFGRRFEVVSFRWLHPEEV